MESSIKEQQTNVDELDLCGILRYQPSFLDSLIRTVVYCESCTQQVVRNGYLSTFKEKAHEIRLKQNELRKVRPFIYQSWAENDYMRALGEHFNLCLTDKGKVLVKKIVNRYKTTKQCEFDELSNWALEELLGRPIAKKIKGGYTIDPIVFSKLGHLSDN